MEIRLKIYISLQKANKILFSTTVSRTIILSLRCETDIQTRIISGPQSFYFMINFFGIERQARNVVKVNTAIFFIN